MDEVRIVTYSPVEELSTQELHDYIDRLQSSLRTMGHIWLTFTMALLVLAFRGNIIKFLEKLGEVSHA